MLLWLWCRPAATALIRSLVWQPPYAAGAALGKTKRQGKKKKRKKPPITDPKEMESCELSDKEFRIILLKFSELPEDIDNQTNLKQCVPISIVYT